MSHSLPCRLHTKRPHRLLRLVLCSYTHDIEALSCDEVLIDGSALLAELSVKPEDLANAIRAEIKEKTGCCASVGMGELMLMFVSCKIHQESDLMF